MTRRVGIIAMLGVWALLCCGQQSGPNERGLWEVWRVGTNSQFMAADSLDACVQFTAKAPRDPFVVVMSGFAAWHYLKQGQTAMAIKLFESMLVEGASVTTIQRAGDTMARSWLTRLDREQVVAALRQYYLEEIAFPESLDALQAHKNASRPPMADRWGKPWSYRLGSSIAGMRQHRYVLESSRLGADSDLKRALARPYGARIPLHPVRRVSGLGETVEFRTSSGMTVRRQAGQEMNDGTLVYLGKNILLLSDGSHWQVMPSPR